VEAIAAQRGRSIAARAASALDLRRSSSPVGAHRGRATRGRNPAEKQDRFQLRDGAKVEAVVIGMGGGSQRGALFGLKLRVQFADGSKTEVYRRVGFHGPNDLPWFVEGSTVPVRYDPVDHSRVEIDLPALRAREQAERSARRERAIADAERRQSKDSAERPYGLAAFRECPLCPESRR
jgi:hypothetical protein